MVVFSMPQNSFVNRHLVKKYLVFVFLFFLLQKFDASDVLAVGFNEEIGQFSYPRPFTHRHHLENEIDTTWDAIIEANGKLKELEREQSRTIEPFGNLGELQEKLNSLKEEHLKLPALQRKYNLEKQESEEMLLTLPQPEIKDFSLYIKEIEQNSFDEFMKSMETIWSIINDAHDKLIALDTTNLTIIKPSEDGNKLTKILNFLESSFEELLYLKQRCTSEEIAQELSDTLKEKKENLSVQLQEMQEEFFDRVAEAEESFSDKLQKANEPLTYLGQNIRDIEDQKPLLEEQINTYDQLLGSIHKKKTEISELTKTRLALESKLDALEDNVKLLTNTTIVQPKRNISDESQPSVENYGQDNYKQIVDSIKRAREQRLRQEDEGYVSLDNLAIRDTPSPTITESNQTTPQQISRKRKRVDSEYESSDDIPLSLRDELEAAKNGITGHAAIDLRTETSPVMEIATTTDMPPATKTATATVTVNSPVMERATAMATPVIYMAPITETSAVMEIATITDMPPVTKTATVTVTSPVAQKATVMAAPVIYMAPITETSPVMEIATITDMPPVTKTATATVTVTSPVTQKATVTATPIIYMAPIIEEVPVMEIDTTTDMSPVTKTATATVTVTSPVMERATAMATPVIYMAPITEEVPVTEIATTTDMPPVTKTVTVDAHPTLVSEHTNTADTQASDTQTVATQTDIVDEQQTSIAIQTDVAAEKPVHEVIQQAAVFMHDNPDVDPYEIFGDNLGLETLFAEEEPIAAEPTAPVDDPPPLVVKQPDQAEEQPTLVAKQTNSETEQTNSETEQTNLESEQPDSSTEQTNLESEQPDSSTEPTNLESEQPDSSTEQTNLESEQPDSSTEQTNLKSEQPDSVAIPSSQTLAEENSYISPINPDIEQDISKYNTYIEFDYLDMISNALTNHTLTDNSTVNVVASGDNDYIKKGGWIQFISSITKQQQQGNILAFKNNQQGFILGFDTRPLDSFIIGIAYALANSYTRLQTIFNDKQNTILHVAAIYTQHTLSQNIYLNSYLKYGKAFIKNKGERNNIAINSKTNGYVTRAKLETYYKMDLDKFLFKPIVGITFDHFLINNFTEYRKEFNINVPTKKGKRILLETGISLSKNILVKNISIIPEIHVKLDNTLLLNNPTGIITFTNTSHQAPTVVPIIKPVGSSAKNVKYTLGGYVNVQSVLPFKLGAGYDYSFKKDLITHSFYFNGLIKF
ncbi:MAG: autotransporter domain-containing protein [Rickettsia endosymbiont of Labidopullus appendiculatus]|nr:autotransporter domain-containing protein [Rickettsia endosymbiont of Labidopullus appendiculatus]